MFELVDRVRRRAIALRQDDDPEERAPARRGPRGLDLGSAEAVIGAFALYFQLVNLVEARGRVRSLRRRERAARDGVLDDSRGRGDLDAAPRRPDRGGTRRGAAEPVDLRWC